MENKLKAIIAPSILSCDHSKLGEECLQVVQSGADWLHIDVMDYNFVPNLSFGPPIIKSLRPITDVFFDVHCMISEPFKWVEDFKKAGANQMTFHYEAILGPKGIDSLCEEIHQAGMRCGLSVKPKTQLDEKIFELIEKKLVDTMLVMTVEPGFGGQSFMTDMMEKVTTLRKKFPNLDIQVDGGIKLENIDIASKAGANIIVSGTGIIGQKYPAQIIKQMRDSVQAQINFQ